MICRVPLVYGETLCVVALPNAQPRLGANAVLYLEAASPMEPAGPALGFTAVAWPAGINGLEVTASRGKQGTWFHRMFAQRSKT